MSWRTVIVSSHAKLDLQVGFLQIRGDNGTHRVVLDEIDVLMVESTAVALTAALLAELVARKVKVIFCDRRHFPVAELVPCRGSHDSSRRLRMQLDWSDETCRFVWQRIVREKILRQADLLKAKGRLPEAGNLEALASEVEPGDTTNREGVAARQYFTALFGSDFSRERPCAANAALDYGYQVMLSVFAREISAEGYALELGIFHNSVYNGFNLASDLIEPFRPLVDAAVVEWFSTSDGEFDKPAKRRLVKLLHEDIRFCGARQTTINAIVSYTRSVTDALSTGQVDDIRFPER